MGKVINLEEYKNLINIFKKPDHLNLYSYDHPDFYEYSKELQKDFPVLKYLCTKSKMYKKSYSFDENENIMYSIFSMPDTYYNYLAIDIVLGNIRLEVMKSKQEDDCYTMKLIFMPLNPNETAALEYIFIIHKVFYDMLLNRLNKFEQN